jgi:hypothetical protein
VTSLSNVLCFGTGISMGLPRLRSDNRDLRGYQSTFTIGHLVAQIIGVDDPVPHGEFIETPNIRRAFLRVWTLPGESRTWPPSLKLDAGGVRRYADLFDLGQ